jgi:sugar phosphate isomerase/epimerase
MLLISTDSLQGYGLNRIFEFVKKAEYDGVELVLSTKDFDTQNAIYVNKLIKENKVPVEVIRTFARSTIKKSEFACEYARKIGAKTVILEPPRLFDFKYVEWLKGQVPKLRKKHGVNIALKNSAAETLLGFLPGRAMNNIGDLKKFGEVCIDTAFLYTKKIDLMRAYGSLKKSLVCIHFSNVRKGKLHSIPMEGVLPLESLLTKLKKDKYKKPISVVVNPRELKVGHDKKMLDNLKAIKDFYAKYYL